MTRDQITKKYRKRQGLNCSALAAFNESPDHALMFIEPKSYFEFGTAFELFLVDHATGSNEFDKRFFVFPSASNMPEPLAKWIEDGIDLETKYKLNKDGSRSQGAKKMHAWLDACMEHPGKMPMSSYEHGCLCLMAENMLKMEVFGITVEQLLKKAVFNTPIYWKDDGIKKKALLDFHLVGETAVYPFDFKTTADLKQARRMIRSRYFLQDTHYTKGITATMKPSRPMTFLVASKAEPFLCQPFRIDAQGRVDGHQKYLDLCDEYVKWEKDGMEPKGFLPMDEIQLYL